MRDDLRKNMEEIEKLETNERKLQIDLNNQIIARNEAVSSLNTAKANLGVFKDEYKKMEESLKATKEDKSNLSNKINSLQVIILPLIKKIFNSCVHILLSNRCVHICPGRGKIFWTCSSTFFV